jgi:hypothetical protein
MSAAYCTHGKEQIQIAIAMGSMAERTNFLLDPAKVPLITRFIREKRNKQKIRLYAGDDIGYYDENELYLRNRPGAICTWNPRFSCRGTN